MNKYIISLVLFLFYFLSNAQLTIRVNSIPSNTPASDNIHIVGNFNDWNPEDDNYILTPDNENIYQISFTPAIGEVEFKFTRGGWTKVEGNENGTFLANRTLNYSGSPMTVDLSILSWEDLGVNSNQTTASENVLLLDDDFYMPQLDRYRKIWIYLPPNYNESVHDYPVIYMHDAQNLFDRYTSFSGEWEIDESLNQLFEQGDDGVIVVGIENGGADRINEYAPWLATVQGSQIGGEGDEYVDFIVETLKPYVDDNYRTQSGRTSTAIIGSSLGGLISMYAAIEHQDIFSKAGIFSPSFWLSPEAYTHVSNTGKEQDMRFYFLGGETESSSMVSDMVAMKNTLLNAGFNESEIELVTHADGQHSEWYWDREFPDAYIWLFANLSSNTTTIPADDGISLFPNPAHDTLNVVVKEKDINKTIRLSSMDGRELIQYILKDKGNRIDLSHFSNGIYILSIFDGQELSYSKQVVIAK